VLLIPCYPLVIVGSPISDVASSSRDLVVHLAGSAVHEGLGSRRYHGAGSVIERSPLEYHGF
jgi:hypothetical protein